MRKTAVSRHAEKCLTETAEQCIINRLSRRRPVDGILFM